MGRKVISMFIVGILLISTQVDMVMGVNLEKILTLKPGDGDTDLNITRPISDRFVLFPIFLDIQIDNEVWIDDLNNEKIWVLDLEKKEIRSSKRPTGSKGYEMQPILGADSTGALYSLYWTDKYYQNIRKGIYSREGLTPDGAKWITKKRTYDTFTFEWDKVDVDKYFSGEYQNIRFNLKCNGFSGGRFMFADGQTTITFDQNGRYTGTLPYYIWAKPGVGYGYNDELNLNGTFYLTESGYIGSNIVKEIPLDYSKFNRDIDMLLRGFDGKGRAYFIEDNTAKEKTTIYICRYDPFNDNYELFEEEIKGDNKNPPKICNYLPLKDGSILISGVQPIDEWDWIYSTVTWTIVPPTYREPENLRLHYWKLEL